MGGSKGRNGERKTCIGAAMVPPSLHYVHFVCESVYARVMVILSFLLLLIQNVLVPLCEEAGMIK